MKVSEKIFQRFRSTSPSTLRKHSGWHCPVNPASRQKQRGHPASQQHLVGASRWELMVDHRGLCGIDVLRANDLRATRRSPPARYVKIMTGIYMLGVRLSSGRLHHVVLQRRAM